MRTVAARLVLTLFAGTCFAQIVSAGVKTGVPLTDLVRTSGDVGGYPFRAETSRFTIGPILDLCLPHGLGFELGAMYKRFPQQTGEAQINVQPYGVVYSPYSRTGQSWEFPMLGRYRFSGEGRRPYLEAGVSYNHLIDALFPEVRTLLPGPATVAPAGFPENRVGAVVGVGLEIKVCLTCTLPPGCGTRITERQNPGCRARTPLIFLSDSISDAPRISPNLPRK